jgi:hypothetical protein
MPSREEKRKVWAERAVLSIKILLFFIFFGGLLLIISLNATKSKGIISRLKRETWLAAATPPRALGGNYYAS